MAQAADPSQLSRHPNNNNNMNDPANVELLLVKSTSRAPPPKEIHFIPGNEEEEEAASVLGGDGASVLMMRPPPEYYSSSAPVAEALNVMTPATATPTIVESGVPPQSCSLSSPNHRLESIPPSPLTVVSVEETATHDTTNDNIARSCVPEQPSSSSSSPGPSITTPLVVTPMESKETTTVVPTTTVFPETHSSTTATTTAVSAVPVIALTTTTNVTEPPAPAAVAAPPRPVVTQEEPTKNLVTSSSPPPPPTTGANAPLALTEPNAPRSENKTATITTTTSLFEQLQQETQERALEEQSLLVPTAMESSSSMNVLPLTATLVPPPTQDETETKQNQVVIETTPSNPVPVVEAAPTTNPVPPPTMTTTTAVTPSDTAFGTPQQDHTQMNISSSNENKNDDDQTDIAIAADETMTDRTTHNSTILPAQPSPVEPNNEAPPVMSVDEPPTRTSTTTTASPSTPLVQESVVDVVVEPGQEEEPIVDPPTTNDVAPSTPGRAPKVANEQAEEEANVQDSAVPAIPLTESTLSGGDVFVQHEEEISTEPATTITLQSLRAKPPLPEPETRLSTKDDNEAAPTPHLTPVDLTATRQVALFEPSVLGEYSEISVPPSTLGLMPPPPPSPPPQDHSVSNELVAPAETTALSLMSSPITSEPLTAPHTNDTTSSSAPSVTLATNTEQPQANGLSNQDLVTVPVPPDQPQVAHSTPQPEMVAVPSLETASPPLESAPPQSGGAVGASTLETVPQSEVAIGASTLETVPPEAAVPVSNLETVPQMQQRDCAVPESPPVTQPETTANAQVGTLPSTDMEVPQSQIASMNTNDGAAVETLTDANRMIVRSLPTAPQDNGQACPDMISSTLMHYANSATSAVASARASATAAAASASTAVGPDSAVDCSFTACMAENVAASAKANLEAWAKQPPAIQGQNMGTGQDQDKGTVEGQDKGTEGASGKAPSDMILGCVPKRILSMDNDDDDDAKPPACPTLPLPSYLQGHSQGQTVKPIETREGVETPATVPSVSEQTQPKQTPQDPAVEETKNNNDQHPATTEATQETFAVTNMVQSLPWPLSELSPPSSPTRSAAKPPTSPIVHNDLDIANYAVTPIELPEGPTTTTTDEDEASSTRAARELDCELFHPVLATATAACSSSSPSQSLKQQEPVGTYQDPQGRDSSDPLSDNDDDEKKEEELTATLAIASKFEKTAVKIARRRRDLKSDIAKHQQELERIRARMSQLRTQFAVHVVALSEIGEVMQDLDEEELAKLEERTELLRTLAEARKINKKTAAAKGTNAKTVLSAIVTPNEHYGGPNSKEPRFTMMDIPQINTMLMEGFDNGTSKDDSSATSRTAWESFEYFLQCGDLTGALAGLDSSKPF